MQILILGCEIMSTIGDRLRKARLKKDLTQVEVSKLTGINNKTLSGYENNVSVPDPETFIILAKLYGVSLDYLMGNDIESEQKNKSTKLKTLINGDEVIINGSVEDLDKIKKFISNPEKLKELSLFIEFMEKYQKVIEKPEDLEKALKMFEAFKQINEK